MKSIISITLAASLVAGSAAAAHNHHQHHHAKKHEEAHKVEKRAASTVHEVIAEATVYMEGGKEVDAEKAAKGVEDGIYVVVGESTPTYVPPPAPKPTTSSSADMGAQFIEKTSTSTSTSTTSTTSSTPPPPSTTSTSKAAPAPTSSQAETPSTGKGLTAKFPSGKFPCGKFPSDYGGVALPHLGLGDYMGIQEVPGWTSAMESISEIVTGDPGTGCKPGSFCGVACPPGWVPSQWPSSQGSTGQSIGGPYCNEDGMLELTNSDYDTLCIPGEGGVYGVNKLSEVVAVCQTFYPGTESMVIPTELQAGATSEISNINQGTYYQWEGKKTSGQFYLQNPGTPADEGCTWNCDKNPESCGNWAPLILGIGYDNGQTYISLFLNTPTSSAKYQGNVAVKGDVTTECKWENGAFSGSDSHGCTTGLPKGGKAYITFY